MKDRNGKQLRIGDYVYFTDNSYDLYREKDFVGVIYNILQERKNDPLHRYTAVIKNINYGDGDDIPMFEYDRNEIEKLPKNEKKRNELLLLRKFEQ
jgi:hypothetical protein